MFRRRLLLAALAVAAVLPVAWLGWRVWQKRDPLALFRWLPGENVLLLHLDVEALRRAAALTSLLESQVPPDPDYAAFVRDTGFDYQRDLDQAVVCYLPDRVFVLARGRFHPERLRAYALAQGGACAGNRLGLPCHIAASRPGQRVSFVLLADDLLALATAPEPDAVLQLAREPALSAEPLAQAARLLSPGAPLLWLTSAPSTLGQALPEAFSPLGRALAPAQRAYLFLSDRAGSIQVLLHAACASPSQAEETRRLLRGLHDLFLALVQGARGSRAPTDWERILASAVVTQQGATAQITWTVDQETLRRLGSATAAAPAPAPGRKPGSSPAADRPAGTGKD